MALSPADSLVKILQTEQLRWADITSDLSCLNLKGSRLLWKPDLQHSWAKIQ